MCTLERKYIASKKRAAGVSVGWIVGRAREIETLRRCGLFGAGIVKERSFRWACIGRDEKD